MKHDDLHRCLISFVEKKDITYKEHNFKNAGINVKSGFCIVKGEKLFIMDKYLKTREKNRILAEYLSKSLSDDIYLLPAVRMYIESIAGQ